MRNTGRSPRARRRAFSATMSRLISASAAGSMAVPVGLRGVLRASRRIVGSSSLTCAGVGWKRDSRVTSIGMPRAPVR